MTRTATDSLRWPLGLALALALGLSGPLAFWWIAAHRPPDRLAVNTWTASGEWNAAQRAQERAREQGFWIDLRARRVRGGVEVEMRANGAGESLPVRLRRERPERSDFDADVPLDDSLHAVVPLPLAGRWLLIARAGDDSAFVERVFAVEGTQ